MRNWCKQWLTGLNLAVAFLGVCISISFVNAQDQRLALPVSVPSVPSPQPSETLRLTFNNAGESKPIILDADEITTWTENGQRVLLLRGQVLVQQNVVRSRMQNGVIWIDIESHKRTGIWHVQMYGEGSVGVDDGVASKSADRAILELNTRGELKLNSHAKPIAKEQQANDPLLQRGNAERSAPAAKSQAPAIVTPPKAPAPAVVPAGPSTVAGPWTPPVIQQASYQSPGTDSQPGAAPGRTVQAPPAAAPPPITPTIPAPVIPGAPPAAPVTPGPGGPPAAVPVAPGPGIPVPGVTPREMPGPPLPPPSTAAVPPTPVVDSPTRQFSVLPRNANLFSVDALPSQPGDNGLQTYIVNGGGIINIRNSAGNGMLDVEADHIVIWTKGVDAKQLTSPTGVSTDPNQGQRHFEFYLSGHVELRQQIGKDAHILRADELYYDTNRNVAIALKAQLEFKPPVVADPIVVRARELFQHAPSQYAVTEAEVFSSKLPSDPGLKVYVRQATIIDQDVPKFGTFGNRIINRTTGEQVDAKQTIFKGQDVWFELENVPFLYSPYLSGDARDPLGPIEEINFGYNRIFGFDFSTTLNLYDLLGIQPFENSKWRGQFDYLTARGPAAGTTFDYAPKEIFGLHTVSDNSFTAYGIYDDGYDVLGGGRTWPQSIPEWRGRINWRQGFYELPYGFSVQTRVAAITDRNFLEEYFINEWLTDPNQETFVYVKQSPPHENWAWTGVVQPMLGRSWVTQTQSLPRADGWLIGQSLFDMFSYNVHGSAGYFNLDITSDIGTNNERVVSPLTDVSTQTSRLDLMQELSLPFIAGPFKVVPYGKLDLTSYSQVVDGDEIGRVWGGGGVRGSIPFSRIYPDVQSELWNLDEMNHKIVFGANYLYAKSNEPYTRFPQLDRLNDDATDQALRDLIPDLPTFYPNLLHSPVAGMFDPQLYAIRRLIENRIDTLDSIDVLQLDIRQRLQTKRGYPGAEHITDWMTLDLSASYFPQANRDNAGQHWAFLQYDYIWNVGDRTTVTSGGWMDPYAHSARVWNIGAFLNRTDRTNFYLGFRYLDGYQDIDPINSRALTGAITYIFSAKYSMTASATYDFGTNLSQSNSLVFTRVGTDLQLSAGITYNALTNSLGAVVEVVPNLVPANKRVGPVTAVGAGPTIGARD